MDWNTFASVILKSWYAFWAMPRLRLENDCLTWLDPCSHGTMISGNQVASMHASSLHHNPHVDPSPLAWPVAEPRHAYPTELSGYVLSESGRWVPICLHLSAKQLEQAASNQVEYKTKN